MNFRFGLFLLTGIVVFQGCHRKDTITPVRKDLTQAVYASGKIYPVNDYKVYSKLPGYIKEVLVKVGDTVKAGQALMTIKNEVSDINVSTAQNSLELARENANENSALLASMKQDLASAQAKYALDSNNYIRYLNLQKSNATSRIAVDQAKTQADISKQNYLKAASNLENTKSRLRIELKNAQNQLQAQQTNKNDFILYSTINGKVYDIAMTDAGELINPQVPLMEIGDINKFEVELMVDETDIALIKPGQKVVYTIDAYKNREFTGTVSEAYPRISAGNKTSKVKAIINLNETVFSGMSVEANIIIQQKKNVLVIPREFLNSKGLVKLKKNKEFATIKTGVQDLEYVEVLSGIDENTEIIKP